MKNIFAESQSKTEMEIAKVLQKIKANTEGQFNRIGKNKRTIEFIGTEEQGEEILNLFNKCKPILLSTDCNNKELVSQFIARKFEFIQEQNFFSLAQVVLILLGIQAQEAYDTGEGNEYNKLGNEVGIWQDIIRRAERIAENEAVLDE